MTWVCLFWALFLVTALVPSQRQSNLVSVGDPDLLAILYRVYLHSTLKLLALLYCISLRLEHYTVYYIVSGETRSQLLHIFPGSLHQFGLRPQL